MSMAPVVGECVERARSGLRDRAGSWGYAALLVVLLLAAFGLRVWNLGLSDLSFDEVATVYVARRPLTGVVRYVMGAAREHPPFYYLLMSLWMQVAGVSEFAIRFPSVLAGVLAVSWGTKLGRRFFGTGRSLWVTALCTLAPFSVWAGRNGRMYALVMLLSFVIMERWLRWVKRPDWRHWLGFTLLSGIGAMTHYYLVLLWPVQGLLLLLLRRETRPIRSAWVATVTAMAAGVAVFIAVSPGVQAMVLEVARRFPVRTFRANELRILLTDLYVWGYRPELVRAGLLGFALTLLGWVLIGVRKPATAAILSVWGLAPLIFLHAVPEKLEARYLMPVFPALVLGLAALLAYLPRVPLRALAAAGLLWIAAWRLPVVVGEPDSVFSSRVSVLHAAVQPGDGLLMNGPWPSLLLTYYEPPEGLTVHAVPSEAPPGFSETVDVPRLAGILDAHERLWVSYGAIHWADPRYSVSRWLAENTYCVFERHGLTLCVPPAERLLEGRGITALSDEVHLTRGAIDRNAAHPGDVVRVLLEVAGTQLDRSIGLNLALLDAEGAVWQKEEFRLGPMHQPSGAHLPDPWREQRGFLIQPGIPPGEYTVALQAYREGVPMTAGADTHGWIAISTLTISTNTAAPELVRLLPAPTLEIPVGSDHGLTVAAFEPHSHRFMQGYAAGFTLWWHVREAVRTQDLAVRLVGPQTTEFGTVPLGPSFYPSTAWQPGEVIKQSVTFELPGDLPAGTYLVEVQTLAQAGAVHATNPEPATPGAWTGVASIQVEARTRQYRAPLLRSRRAIRFADTLLLQGFRLGQTRPKAGADVALTVYWKAMARPDRIYAVFNHLRAADGTVVWQGDSWPQDGLYTTDRWMAGEVVAETYTVHLPADLPPGTYAFYTGVYDPATGERLEATTRAQALINNEVALFEWVIKP